MSQICWSDDQVQNLNYPKPWVRPGIVVHDPMESIDGLLAQFALTLRDRGFRVVGYVQQNNLGGVRQGGGCQSNIDFFSLSTLNSITVERDETAGYLHQAMRENADLLVFSRFSSFLEATENGVPTAQDIDTPSIPLLTSIAGRCVQKWHDFTHHQGAMISPDITSLWHWWGPDHLYQDLALGVDDDAVLKIVCGSRWIMVQGPYGTGLSYLPRSPQSLLDQIPVLSRQSLRQLAQLVHSWNPLETALGMAAINAHYNRRDLAAFSGNGTKAFRHIPGQVAVIGAFPGLDGILPRRTVLEADPKPGEFPLTAMDAILPGSAAVIANSSVLVNRSLPRILRLAPNRPLALIGPGTPLTARLQSYGIQVAGGLVIDDADGLAKAIRAGALPREFGRFGRNLHLNQGIGAV